MRKYTIKDFMTDFPDDVSCLEWLKNHRWPYGITCKNCQKVTKHHLVESRKSFSCQECGNHVHPTAGTIFHKSRTPLTSWFYAIYLMSSTRCGISAKQVEREIGTTYKTAWRMCRLIRERLCDEGKDPFSSDDGDVEADESYVGGKPRYPGQTKRGRGSEKKTPVFGLAQRQGDVRITVVPDVQRKTLSPLIQENVQPGTKIHTDEFNVYDNLTELGYEHGRVNHGVKQWVDGDSHTNTLEGFWAQVKNAVRGVHHGVAPKYLQLYVNEYAFRYNRRNDDTPMFLSFLNHTGLGWDETTSSRH